MAVPNEVPDLDLSALNNPAPQQGSAPTVPQLHPFSASVSAADSTQPGQAIRTSAPAAAHQPTVIPIGEETIEIAPHPTTNRFPWAPVENPKVPIYQVVQPEPEPVAPPPPPPPPPAPVQLPPPPPPKPVAPPPPPPPPPVELPPPPPPVPVAPPQPEPEPVAPPPPPPPPPAPVQLPPPPPPKPVAPPPPQRMRKTSRPVHIYSDYTREVWRVLRPSKIQKILLLISVVVVISFIIMFWYISGAPTNIMDLPLLQPILKAE